MAIKELNSSDKQILVETVIEQIRDDLLSQDETAIEVLLNNINCENLISFLSEEKQKKGIDSNQVI